MYNNPRHLLIGQRIFFKHIAVMDYVEKDDVFYREVLHSDEDRMGYCQVVGCVKKAIGIYHKAYAGHYNLGGEDDYEPAHLEVEKYVWLYECRKDIAGKTFLVHPDDVQLPEDRIGRREQLIGDLAKFMSDALTPGEWQTIVDQIKQGEEG